jgi:hypothetical protein
MFIAPVRLLVCAILQPCSCSLNPALVSQLRHLKRLNYRFWAHPFGFTIHVPHDAVIREEVEWITREAGLRELVRAVRANPTMPNRTFGPYF